jgi:tripartite-type tricarboxylate transporter receptor subunit TctC
MGAGCAANVRWHRIPTIDDPETTMPMHTPPRGRRAAVWLLAATALAPAAAQAQSAWPTKPLTIVVPFPVGGGTDAFARPLSAQLTKQLGQQVIIDNKGGAGGTLGAQIVASAEADGYTLLYATPGQQMTNPHLMKQMPYDALKAFSAVSRLVLGGSVLVVHKDVPVKSVAELIAFAKSKPGSLSCASAGVGASSHLACELFKAEAKVDIVHVPYKGSGAAVVDVVGGRVPMAIDSYSVYKPHIASGAVRAIAVSSEIPNPATPDLPTIAKTLPGFEATPVNYITAPAGTPRPIIDRLNREINAVLEDPEVKAYFAGSGVITKGSTPAEMDELVKRESDKWKRVIELSGAKAE